MTQQKVIIGIGILAGLLLYAKTKPTFLKVILIGLSISFGLTFFKNQLLTDLSFFSFGILTIGFSVHQAANRKWTNFAIGLFAFLSFIWGLFQYPFIGELRFLMLLPIGLYIWTLITKWNTENGLSILTVLTFYELSEFLIFIGQWTQIK
ncbi:hypothetical protein EYD45_13950 [Hyunsoonleella flava]|uniref:Uncharacterized protein n=1 Tax=Hyunsoonleella flava TaxID=2527939 RepID=A0A4Q9FC90_9FLAO|nr:hypothetical protein [Hyunsoonleella flava]TBN00921.1 hypothetical protein EYD45_13950 [Hyunsoonleella flava]